MTFKPNKILFLLLLIYSINGQAQDYKNAARVSFGHYWGVAFKHMFTQESGTMGNFQLGENSLVVSGFRVFHKPAFPETSSQWFLTYGYGLHLAYRTKIRSRNAFRPFAPAIVHEGNFISPGIDGYVGLEYRFLKYPFTISGDFGSSSILGK
ncbi:MAG: hypothetical protein N4A74_06700 [Carboxylicivirga sp.]|jgi:hypothetical protein|nr:hypothetical protein [Carboxylicivirga sp.]